MPVPAPTVRYELRSTKILAPPTASIGARALGPEQPELGVEHQGADALKGHPAVLGVVPRDGRERRVAALVRRPVDEVKRELEAEHQPVRDAHVGVQHPREHVGHEGDASSCCSVPRRPVPRRARPRPQSTTSPNDTLPAPRMSVPLTLNCPLESMAC
jgi:hypothetical protein